MTNWFLFALIAPALWAITNLIDSHLMYETDTDDAVTQKSKRVFVLMLYSCFVGIVVSLGIVLFGVPVFAVDVSTRGLLVLGGILEGIGFSLYLYALLTDETSRVTAWFNLIPVVTGIGAWVLFDEILSQQQLLGAAVIILGSLWLVLSDRARAHTHKRLTAPLMLGAIMAFCGSYLLFEHSTIPDDFWLSSFWQYLGLFVFGLILTIGTRGVFSAFISNVRTMGIRMFALNSVNETINVAGNFVITFAILMAPTGLVLLAGPYQPLFVLLFTWILMLCGVRIENETMTRRSIVQKSLLFAVMIIGTWILLG